MTTEAEKILEDFRSGDRRNDSDSDVMVDGIAGDLAGVSLSEALRNLQSSANGSPSMNLRPDAPEFVPNFSSSVQAENGDFNENKQRSDETAARMTRKRLSRHDMVLPKMGYTRKEAEASIRAGNSVLILMRGAPGAGKTTMAK